MADIVVTWPKSRPFASYMTELSRAVAHDEVAYFRVSSRPNVERHDRCYHVHDGFVRGYLNVLDLVELAAGESVDSVTGLTFAPGLYVVRSPIWRPLATPVPMKGFRGFRYVMGRL